MLAGGGGILLFTAAASRLVEPGPPLPPPFQGAALLAGRMGLMMGVCLLSCVVPLRRALAVEPTEALAADG